MITKLDRAVEAGRRQAGMPVAEAGGDGVALRVAVQTRLRELAPLHDRMVRDAIEEYQRATVASTAEAVLRQEWSMLTPAERDAVRSAVPNVAALLDPARTPGRSVARESTPEM